MTNAALAGIRVVDLGGTIATGYCGKLFAAYGAEVINIEPPEGAATRHTGPFVGASRDSALHAWLSLFKKSVVRAAGDTDRIARLVESAQLVLDAGDNEFASRCGAVRTSITWYGEGPRENFIGSDAQMFAFNGMLRNIGEAGGPPLIPAGYQGQVVAGATAYIPSLGEVLGMERSAAGQHPAEPIQAEQVHAEPIQAEPIHIETSVCEAMLCFTDVGAVGHYNTGLEGSRMGINRFPPTYPMGVYPCRDGWLGVSVLTPSQWRAFCELLDMPEFAEIEMFQTAIGRFEALDVIEPVFSEKLLEHAAEDLFYRGQAMAIPLARVPTMEELFDVDQFVSRQAFADAGLPAGGQVKVPTVPFRLHATPPVLGGPVAALGENSKEYL